MLRARARSSWQKQTGGDFRWWVILNLETYHFDNPAPLLSHHTGMPKRSSKRPDDFQNALRVVEEAIGAKLKKNPAAVALGRRGGLKGGKARASKLTAA